MSYPRNRDTPGVPASPDFPRIEERVLEFWRQDDTFRASVSQREGAPEWVFYDGPPFANGLPHYGHLLTGYAKDVFPRFQTMRGKQVQRRFGWDTHGLPAELEAMRQLGITTKDQIEDMGVENFNVAARESVLRYTKEWESYVTRQARWVDFENAYKTLDVGFMESVIWAFKRLYDQGLAYEGFRVLPYCWNDETPLSNHELRMDDEVYKSRQDQTVTVTFPLMGARAEELGLAGVTALAWTTTPWTLPTNAALAVGPDIAYAVVPTAPSVSTSPVSTSPVSTSPVSTSPVSTSPASAARVDPVATPATYLMAVDTVAAYAKELGYGSSAEAIDSIERTIAGSELEGVEYAPLWDFYVDAYGAAAFRILIADYVATGEGTGIVHQAPAYGEDDQITCARYDIPVVLSLDDGGRFLPQVALVEGKRWDDANPILTRALRDAGRLFQQKSYDHSYPHCWRCKQPLIYKAVSSWFVRVTDVKDEMLDLNEAITWVPENVKHGQFGKWVENARDWSVSRNRYWGSPIPVWKSDDPAYPRIDVYGSLEELERDFGRLPTGPDGAPNLHRPYIDELTRPNPDDPTGMSTMRRIEDVLDVWFDSGSMPFAQVHYPFENREWFESHYPADFIVEYIGQTRGWFYVMHVLAAALFKKNAFSNVISHGIVLGNDGQKMSKSLRNYPDVSEVFDRDGADAMRWFLMSSSVIRGGNLIVTEEGIRAGVRELMLPLWSSWYFFALYANTAALRVSTGSTRDLAGSTGVLAGSTRVLSGSTGVLAGSTGVLSGSTGVLAGSTGVLAGSTRDLAGSTGGNGYTATWRTDSTRPLDRYILAKTRDMLEAVTGHFDSLDSPLAAAALRDFADVLTNWYVRRSRDRFWDGSDTDAFDTLFTVLETLARASAPLLPLVTEEIWQGLTAGRSVHLADWPDAAAFPVDPELVATMDLVREIASAGLSLRKARQLRVRLPLPSLTVVAVEPHALAEYADIIRDELNVKQLRVEALDESSWAEYGITRRLSVNARALGPRLGTQVQAVIGAARTGAWTFDGNAVTVAGISLHPGEFDLVLEAVDPSRAIAFLPDGDFVILDTTVTPELEAEGIARDVVRAVQQARRDAELEVSDRIALRLGADAATLAAVATHADMIRAETLSVALATEETTGAGVENLRVSVTKATA